MKIRLIFYKEGEEQVTMGVEESINLKNRLYDQMDILVERKEVKGIELVK